MNSFLRAAALSIAIAVLGSMAAAQDFEKGFATNETGDYTTALKEFRPLAEQGDASAQFNLGVMYGSGQGVAKYDAEAVRLYQLAADQDLADAQFNLGTMYRGGKS